jgi:hypothetical protein
MEEPTIWPFPSPSVVTRRERALVCEEVVMVHAAIGVAILLVPVCVGLYFKHHRSRNVVSTTEWVRLMRKNDLRFDRATKARAIKSRMP